MRKLSILLGMMVVMYMNACPIFAAYWNIDCLEPGNPGGWGKSLKTFDNQCTVVEGETLAVDIWINGAAESDPLCGGVWIDFQNYSDLIDLVEVQRFNNSELPGPWSRNWGLVVIGPAQNVPDNHVLIRTANFNYAPRDVSGDIIIARCLFKSKAPGTAEINISLPPEPNYVEWTAKPPWFDNLIPDTTLTIHQISGDTDSDGIKNDADNCPQAPNGPEQGTCVAGANYKIGRPCMNNDDCGEGGSCSTNQEDSDPPGGDGIGDACYLCASDFTCDQDVDGSDAVLFKAHFGRNAVAHPCTNEDPCNGDFTCDGDADGSDAAKFKSEFGRGASNQPCPNCTQGGLWCLY